MATVSFYACTLSQYSQLASTDPDALYVVSDAGKIYKGDIDVTKSTDIVDSWETIDPVIEDRLYINVNTGEIRTYHSKAWYVVSPPIATNAEDFDDPTKSEYLVKLQAIKEFTESKISTALDYSSFVRTITYGDGKLLLDMGTHLSPIEVELTGVANNPTYDTETSTLTIPVYGHEDVVVNIPKDTFVKSGRFEPNYLLPDGTYGPAIVLVVEDQEGHDKEIVIPAGAMVNIYKGGETSTITVTVNNDTNVISASVNISEVSGNGIIAKDDGLYVDIHNFASKYAADAKLVLVSDGQGGFKPAEGDIQIATSGDLSKLDDSYLATANVITSAITAAVTALQQTLEERILALEARFSTFNDNEVILANSNQLQSSGVTIGNAILEDTPSDKVLATESAVDNIIFRWS